jgi:predicted RNA-binding Zn ribbon-like protein
MLFGDHPALNLLNTVSRINGQLIDSFQGEDDVLQWLKRAGWPVEHNLANFQPSLLHSARTLRETIRTLVEERKAGRRGNSEALNACLAQAQSYLELIPRENGSFQLQRKWKQQTPAQILAPLAEAAAELLAMEDFSLIRRCENEECVLWFYDRTKSHHRRWCSMAACGNRHKVAAFRKRRQNGA